jgi:PBP1b-binding outer membrane lipoprotein LpoB
MVKALLLALLLTGCAAPKTQIEYRVADVPEPPVINRPDLPVLTITKDMDPGTIIQLHRETILVLKAWGLELEAALNAYRKPK